MIAPRGFYGPFGIGAVTGGGLASVPKIIGAAGIGALGAFLLGQKMNQTATQTGMATTGGYTFYAQPGSTLNLTNPQTGQATTQQTQQQQQLDLSGISGILMIAAVIAVIMMLRK
jgi:hypothetical protein